MKKHFVLSLTNGEGYTEPILEFCDKEKIQSLFDNKKSEILRNGCEYKVETNTNTLYVCTEIDEDENEIDNFAIHQMSMEIGESFIINTNYVIEFYDDSSIDLEDLKYTGKEVFEDYIEDSYEDEDEGTVYIKITII